MTVTIGDGSNGYPINQYASILRTEYKDLLKDREVAAHAKRLALELECVLLDRAGYWQSAQAALDAYQADLDRLYPQDHVSPLGKE